MLDIRCSTKILVTHLPPKQPDASKLLARTLAKSLREQFGADIREARLRARMSQTDVGRVTGKGQTYVSEIELGQTNITIDTMLELAHAVGLDVVLITRVRPAPRPKASSSE
jgi:ribosome-binding protein aMBF1 (putative translation factor)